MSEWIIRIVLGTVIILRMQDLLFKKIYLDDRGRCSCSDCCLPFVRICLWSNDWEA
jgi:hypothetical protein